MIKFKYATRRDREFPIIPITLIKENIEIDTDGLVDSGANISVFREEIAECLEIIIEDGEEILLQGLGGRIVGYIHELRVRIDDEKFPCKVVFSKELTVGLNILGREGFFEYFQITFNERDKDPLRSGRILPDPCSKDLVWGIGNTRQKPTPRRNSREGLTCASQRRQQRPEGFPP